MIYRLLLLIAILFGAVPTLAQDVSVRYSGQVIGSRGLPLANQNVAVCTQPATTTTQPCSPLATLATSTSTSSGGANPLTTDVNGNFFFYAAPGKYTVQVYGPQVSGQFVQGDTILSCSPTGNCTHSGTETFTGAPALTASNAGVFTNTQSQFYLQSLLNSCNPTTEFHFSQGNSNNTTDGLTGCLTMPNGATVHQGNAVAGYVNTSCNSASRTVCNAVGGYFWGRAVTSSSAVWGINGIVNDTPATTSTNVQASELDIGIAGTPSFVCGQCLNLSGTGLGTGTMPVNSFGFSISAANALQFNFGYNSSRGATTNAGLFLDGQNTTNNTFSQSIELAGYDGGGTQHVVSINATPTGSVNLTPAAGQYVTLPAGTGTELLEGADPGGVATADICDGNSTLHMKKCSYNNGPFLPMPQTNNAGGTHSDSGLYQSKRAVAGCTTGAAAGNSCASDITVTWGTAFADANYSVACTGSTPTNVPSAPFVVSASKLAASVHINYFAITAAAASYATIDCIAVHD